MNEQESDILVQRLYDRIFDSLTQGDGVSAAAFDPSSTFLTLEPRGRIIDPKSFVCGWTPANPGGSHGAAIAVSNIANEAPIFCVRHTPGAAEISAIYEQVLRAKHTGTEQPNRSPNAVYKRAYEYLNAHIQNPAVPGQLVPQQSPAYQAYQANQAAYRNAISALRAAHIAALADPKLQATWPLLAASLEARVHRARDAWLAGEAQEVEAALAALERLGAEQVEQAFGDAAELFESYKMPFVEGEPRLSSSLLPSHWWEPGVSDSWPAMHFNNAAANANPDSDYPKYCGGGGFSIGLWSAGEHISAVSPSFNSDAMLDSINISYKYTLVSVCRPWLAAHLFKLPGWRMDATKKGTLSSGSRAGQENAALPLIPQAFIAIKDLTVTGSFSTSELNQANSLIGAGVPLSFGPFAISGSQSYTGSEQYVKGTADPSGIRAPFVQIIGWVNAIQPFSPPE